MNIKIDPVESYVFDGLVNQCSKVFGCPTVIGNSQDKVRILKKLTSDNVSYPYIFINDQRVGYNAASYSSNRLSRSGVLCLVNDDTGAIHQVRLVPTNFDLEIQFITNSSDSRKVGSWKDFQKRWLFAYRAGHLKFNINYGNLELRIGCTLSESLDSPALENKTEQQAHYECNASITVHGFVSDPQLKHVGVVKKIDMQEVLGTNATFVPFRS